MKTIIIVTFFAGLAVSVLAEDGAALFQKCISCHGAKGEKVALGKSKIIAEMSKEDIVKALKGYQDGSYGGVMKMVMKGQVATLDDANTKPYNGTELAPYST